MVNTKVGIFTTGIKPEPMRITNVDNSMYFLNSTTFTIFVTSKSNCKIKVSFLHEKGP